MDTSLTAEVATTRTVFDLLFRPRSIALIGASTNPEALGGRPLGFLQSYGYAGTVYPVNARSDTVQGVAAFASILDVPEPVDLALIAVRAELVPGVLRECMTAGAGVAVVMSSGFGEGMGHGADLAQELLDDLAAGPMRVLGPNCEGLASLPAAAPMTFSPVLDIRRTGSTLKQGGIAIVSQSGGLGFAVAGWGTEVGLGYNYIVTTGNEIDLDGLELAEGLVEAAETEALVLVIEEIRDLPRFERLATRSAELGKHLVVAKLGGSPAGARGALAHTGHVSDGTADYDEVFRRHGVLSVDDNEELIDVLQAVAKAAPLAGPRVGIVTTSGGAGVWLADALSSEGLVVPELGPAAQTALAAHMPPYGSPVNPVDLTAQFLAGGSFAPPMRALIDTGEIDLLVLTTSLSSSGRLTAEREELARLVAESPIPIAVYTYTKPAPSCVEILNELDVPWYTSSRRAARGLASLVARSNS